MSVRRTALGVAVALGSGAALLHAPPAQARVVESDVIHEEYSDSYDEWCGEPLTVDVVGTHDLRYRVVSQGRDGLVHFRGVDKVSETHTANGVTTRFVLNSPSTDLKVVDNGDGTLTITVLATGNAVLYGPSGKAIARDPGQVRFRITVDHGGTPTDPSDDVEIEGSFEQIKGSTGRSDDFCAAEMAAFGA